MQQNAPVHWVGQCCFRMIFGWGTFRRTKHIVPQTYCNTKFVKLHFIQNAKDMENDKKKKLKIYKTSASGPPDLDPGCPASAVERGAGLVWVCPCGVLGSLGWAVGCTAVVEEGVWACLQPAGCWLELYFTLEVKCKFPTHNSRIPSSLPGQTHTKPASLPTVLAGQPGYGSGGPAAYH